MEAAVAALAGENFITPMAAVAGSVADEILAAMLAGRRLDKAYVNNGGDSALHLAPGESMRLAIAGTGKGFADRILIRAEDPVRGVATCGWRGRVPWRTRRRRSSQTPSTCPAIRLSGASRRVRWRPTATSATGW
jgi:ApbE superfamily uncharacterized protein (UPF0280 family)